MKLKNLLLCGALIVSLISSMEISIQAAVENESITAPHNERLKKSATTTEKINHAISQQLYNKKTYLSGHWTSFIRKINYLKNNQLEIYVTDSFKKISEKKQTKIINLVQHLSLDHVEELKGLSTVDYQAGLPTLIFCNGKLLGRSEFLNYKEFVWNK